MCEKTFSTWRDLATNLYNEGMNVTDICVTVYNEFKTSFKAQDSSTRTIKRYLRETFGITEKTQTPKLLRNKSLIGVKKL